MIEMTPSTAASPGIVNKETLQFAYEVTAEDTGKDHIPFDKLVDGDHMADELQAITTYTARLASTKDESPPGHVFLNGKYFPGGPVSGTIDEHAAVWLM